MTKKELIKVLSENKIPENCEIKVLCNRSYPIAAEIAYYDKKDNRVIIETN
jgi:hypothetical protein